MTVAADARRQAARDAHVGTRRTMRLAFRESDRQSSRTWPAFRSCCRAAADGARRVADFVVRPSDREIQRINRLTAVVVSANIAKGSTLEQLRKRVEPILNDYPLPPGYTWKFGRGFEENDKAIQTMSQNLILAVVLIFLVMASLFESTLYPLSIITSILFAIVGAIWFLTLTGTTITMMAMIGFMILVGVVGT
jgi:HAE1 family hydrophobic/amphiphilic exporter-1